MVMDDPSLRALTEATAGAVGGLLSTTILYPLDTCKTRFQAEAASDGRKRYSNIADVLREAVASGDISSLYAGLATKNMQSVLTGFVYFYAYSFFKTRYLASAHQKNLGLLANLAVAASAGACTAVVTQPWDTLSARMQTSRPGEGKGFVQMLREGGLAHAFDGLGVSLLLVSNPAIQYTMFEQIKTRWLRRNATLAATADTCGPPPVLSAAAAFIIGALSKTIATIATYPAIRCKVMMQRAETEEEKQRRAAGDLTAGPPKTMALAMRVIWQTEGLPGFFKGIQAQILKTVLSSALMLMIKEQVSFTSRSLVLAIHRSLSSLSSSSSSSASAAARRSAAAAAAALPAPVKAVPVQVAVTRRPPAAAAAAGPALHHSLPVASAPAPMAAVAAAAAAATAGSTRSSAHSHVPAVRPSAPAAHFTTSHSPGIVFAPSVLPPPTSTLHLHAAGSPMQRPGGSRAGGAFDRSSVGDNLVSVSHPTFTPFPTPLPLNASLLRSRSSPHLPHLTLPPFSPPSFFPHLSKSPLNCSSETHEFARAAVAAYAVGCTEEGLRRELTALLSVQPPDPPSTAAATEGAAVSETATGTGAAASVMDTEASAAEEKDLSLSSLSFPSSVPSAADISAESRHEVQECVLWVAIVFVTIAVLPQPVVTRWAMSKAASPDSHVQWKGFCSLIANAYYTQGMAWYSVEQMAVAGVAEPAAVVADRMRLVFTTLEVVDPRWGGLQDFPTL
ncbi:unnamed protein product [Closterium sp. Naga37s-1]|nr:unnamed protein product [Closterium sp. Naga37s-1]